MGQLLALYKHFLLSDCTKYKLKRCACSLTLVAMDPGHLELVAGFGINMWPIFD